MRVRVWATGLVLGLTGGLFAVVAASAAPSTTPNPNGGPAINVAPTSVPVGGTVTVAGSTLLGGHSGCPGATTVTLISGAFAGQGSFQNQDVEAPIDANGSFSVDAKILPGVTPGTFTITGRCGGANMGVEATLTVTGPGQPATGVQPATAGGPPIPIAPISVGVALAAVALLPMGVWTLRRRSG